MDLVGVGENDVLKNYRNKELELDISPTAEPGADLVTVEENVVVQDFEADAAPAKSQEALEFGSLGTDKKGSTATAPGAGNGTDARQSIATSQEVHGGSAAE